MRNVVIAVLLILVIAGIGGYAYFAGRTYEVRITEADLRAKIEPRFPMTKSLLILEATLSQPRVALIDGSNRVALGIDVELNLRADNNPRPLGGRVDVEATLRYQPGAGAFYLDAPDIRRLDVQGVSDKYTATAREVVRAALAHDFAHHPVYTLSLANANTGAARLVLRKVAVEHGILILTLGV